MNISGYVESQLDKDRIFATDCGKEFVRHFVKALRLRVRADARYGESRVHKTDDLYAACARYFFKWLAEVPEFDKMASPVFTVPIFQVYQRWDGKIVCSHNMLGENNPEQAYLGYYRLRWIVRYAMRDLRKQARKFRREASRHGFQRAKKKLQGMKLLGSGILKDEMNRALRRAENYVNRMNDFCSLQKTKDRLRDELECIKQNDQGNDVSQKYRRS